MDIPEKIDSLSLLDLDVDVLEERIEMSALGHLPLYGDYCGTNCSVAHPVRV